MILVKLPNKGVWVNPKTAEELIDTWGGKDMLDAVATAQELIRTKGEIGDTYEIIQVEVVSRTVIQAERVGVVKS